LKWTFYYPLTNYKKKDALRNGGGGDVVFLPFSSGALETLEDRVSQTRPSALSIIGACTSGNTLERRGGGGGGGEMQESAIEGGPTARCG